MRDRAYEKLGFW